MRIQHNIAALNSYRQLSNNNNSVSKNLEKLSSGFRINRAGDDAAGLAISEKMRAQITGLETAQKNANDGISLVQTAEGALTEVHSMLNRMVELAGQSANGTYDNETDRANLQKEVQSLKDEINRISEGTNFNGINLLDGSVNEAHGIAANGLSYKEVGAKYSDKIGTTGTGVNGVHTKGSDAVDYSAKFYVGDITNNDGTTDHAITLTYNDNSATAATNTIVLTVAGGTTVTTEDIFDALKNGTNDKITVTDNGDGSNAGSFNDLYNVSLDDTNVLTITAKSDGVTIGSTTEKIVGSRLGDVAITNDFVAADETAAEQAILANLAGTGATNIQYGSLTGQAKEYQAAVDGSYQLASIQLTLEALSTGADNHNKGVTVGNRAYIIQSGDEELKVVPEGAVVVKVAANDDTAAVAAKLAEAITADEQGNGNYIATANAGVLTISESTNRAEKILNGEDGYSQGTSASVASLTQFITTPGTVHTTGDLTLDASEITDGSTITVGDKVYMLTKDASVKTPEGAKAVVIASDATDEEAAQALVDAMTEDGIEGLSVTKDTGKITFADSDTNGTISAEGAGLTLQIGDTAESFNQMSVKIQSTSTTALGIDGIDISSQTGAKTAIDTIKDAINSVSSNRGDLGAIQNRLEHTINNLGVTSENMTAAESRIRDVDMAKEMMAYTKNNILVQASQAMLAQANQIPQGVLQLLQ